MPRPAPAPGDRFLTAQECADRRRVHVSAWWAEAAANRGLERGCKRGVGRSPTLWLESAVTRYLRSLAGGVNGRARPTPARRAPQQVNA